MPKHLVVGFGRAWHINKEQYQGNSKSKRKVLRRRRYAP
jgi:hypothetical protein